MRRFLLVAALVCGFAGSSSAQPAATSVLSAWDTNGDGVITKDEWLAAEHTAKEFAYSDTNHDGKVTLQELKVALKKVRSLRSHRAHR